MTQMQWASHEKMKAMVDGWSDDMRMAVLRYLHVWDANRMEKRYKEDDKPPEGSSIEVL